MKLPKLVKGLLIVVFFLCIIAVYNYSQDVQHERQFHPTSEDVEDGYVQGYYIDHENIIVNKVYVRVPHYLLVPTREGLIFDTRYMEDTKGNDIQFRGVDKTMKKEIVKQVKSDF